MKEVCLYLLHEAYKDLGDVTGFGKRLFFVDYTTKEQAMS